MIIVCTYNILSKEAFPYPSGMHTISAQSVHVVQGIFTGEHGEKSPTFVTRADPGYRQIEQYLSEKGTDVIAFFGKESSGAVEALDLFLKDYDMFQFGFHPLFCRHVSVLEQAKLVRRRIRYSIFIDYEMQCQEARGLEDALLGTIARRMRHPIR